MLKLSAYSRKFLQENNLNLLLLLEDAAQQQDAPMVDSTMNSDDEPVYVSGSSNNSDSDSDTNAMEASGQNPDDTGMMAGAAVDPTNQQMPTEEDIINQDINIADSKFVQFRLYDKITNLQDLINNLKNITTLNEDERDNLEHFSDYVAILNELIFTLDVNVIYQLIGQLEIDMTTFLESINERAIQKKENKKLGESE